MMSSTTQKHNDDPVRARVAALPHLVRQRGSQAAGWRHFEQELRRRGSGPALRWCASVTIISCMACCARRRCARAVRRTRPECQPRRCSIRSPESWSSTSSKAGRCTPEDVRNPANLERLVDVVRRAHHGDSEISARSRRPCSGCSTSCATTLTRSPRAAAATSPELPALLEPRRQAGAGRRPDRGRLRPQRSPRRQFHRRWAAALAVRLGVFGIQLATVRSRRARLQQRDAGRHGRSGAGALFRPPGRRRICAAGPQR